jgi:hypothetical protein
MRIQRQPGHLPLLVIFCRRSPLCLKLLTLFQFQLCGLAVPPKPLTEAQIEYVRGHGPASLTRELMGKECVRAFAPVRSARRSYGAWCFKVGICFVALLTKCCAAAFSTCIPQVLCPIGSFQRACTSVDSVCALSGGRNEHANE